MLVPRARLCVEKGLGTGDGGLSTLSHSIPLASIASPDPPPQFARPLSVICTYARQSPGKREATQFPTISGSLLTRRLPGQPRSRNLLAYSLSRASRVTLTWPCCLLLPSKPPPPSNQTPINHIYNFSPHTHAPIHPPLIPKSLVNSIFGLPSFHSFRL